MKKYNLLGVLVLCVWAVLASAADEASRPEHEPEPKPKDKDAPGFAGSWELVKGKYLAEDQKWITSEQAKITSLKILNQTHYSFTSYSDGKFWGAGTGTYSIDNQQYIETPIYVSYSMEKGKQYQFEYVLEGDLWTNRRIENGKLVEEELWRRIKVK